MKRVSTATPDASTAFWMAEPASLFSEPEAILSVSVALPGPDEKVWVLPEEDVEPEPAHVHCARPVAPSGHGRGLVFHPSSPLAGLADVRGW